ncbi:endonuclease [Pseudomonas oryzae]|uniref:Deoxyribonuclease-1 n=1 Tax=Pseudomonas oryzae TaxID=1392877 RepID=A0A1H1XYB0_9PSED|nr:endonuclease [Pseudomonas oryzae]SDT14115.1 deoxyribonuclease-1 [Pseudomonas oryzae]
MRKPARRKSARKKPASRLLGLALGLLAALAATLLIPPQAPDSFPEAKQLARQIHGEQGRTFYCGCAYQDNRVDLASCGYRPRKNRERAARIEWEHVVPAWVIGHQRQCWQRGGREHCSKSDPLFARAEADLHNLVPAIGEVNGDRSNFPFALLPTRPHQYGQCQMVVDFRARKAMPPEHTRGAIARTYLYMHERYRLLLSKQDRQLYEAWHRQYPADDEERRRNQAIACEMGWGNPYVGEVELWRCGFGRLGALAGSALAGTAPLARTALGAVLGR